MLIRTVDYFLVNTKRKSKTKSGVFDKKMVNNKKIIVIEFL